MTKPVVISGIEIYKFDIPFTEPITVALGTFHHAPNILVRIISEDGVSGVGRKFAHLVDHRRDSGNRLSGWAVPGCIMAGEKSL